MNAGLVCEKTPLYFAVQYGAVSCVKELLDHHASPNTSQVMKVFSINYDFKTYVFQIFSETPLHLAASLGNQDILKLLLGHGAAVNIQCGPDKATPLHLAAEDGDIECVKILIDAGATVTTRNKKQQTPLHLAALSQSTETIELLLRMKANPNAIDIDGRTPLHSSIVKVTRSCECVRILLDAGAEVNKPDVFGYTPLHLAALNEFPYCVMLLINAGGDVTMRTNGGISVLTFITRKTPEVIPKYVSKFDSSIKLNEHELGDVDCELKLDFRILVPSVGNKETELLLNFIEVGHRHILKHPLSETFLFLKWGRIRKFFLFSMMYHLIFGSLYTFYIIKVFLKNCPSAKSIGQICWVANYIRNIGYIIIVFNMLFLAKELFQIAHSWRSYIKHWENWLQWLIILSVFCCVQPKPNMNIKEDVYDWQHHVAALSIFLTWLELMMIVGRFPIFGLYIQMFTRVFVNFVKFMLAYFCLFIAFALSFGVIFANYPAFTDLKWVLVKVIIMMSGELEYEDVFFPENAEYEIKYPYTAHIMYFCFVLLVTLILNNLLVGLAVSDIQGLQQSAGLDRLVRQVEMVAHLESMLFSRLLKWMPNKLMKFFHNQALLLKSRYQWALYLRPNDPREQRIPKELVQNIYQLVVARKERPPSRRHKKIKTEYSNVMSDISRMGSLYSENTFRNKNNDDIKTQLDDLLKEFQENTKIFLEKLHKIADQLTKSPK